MGLSDREDFGIKGFEYDRVNFPKIISCCGGIGVLSVVEERLLLIAVFFLQIFVLDGRLFGNVEFLQRSEVVF